MPAVRAVKGRPGVIVYAPRLYDSGFKQHVIDGESLGLHAHLIRSRLDSALVDAYNQRARGVDLEATVADHDADAVLVHLWTSDSYGAPLRRIAADLARLRAARPGLLVAGFGPIATSAAADLFAVGALDAALNLDGTITNPAASARCRDMLDSLRRAVQTFLTSPTTLDVLPASDLPAWPDPVVSIGASRGCRAKCTFCAYNTDAGLTWIPRQIADALTDVRVLHEGTGARRFAFMDTDFGGTKEACRARARLLRQGVERLGLEGQVTFSVNVRAETLDDGVIADLAAAGIRAILIGVESFNPYTLSRIYGKRQDLGHLREVVAAADAHGLVTVASYILWHPWQTLDGVRGELWAIEEFGLHRIPQFLARSRLLVIPGTRIEAKIRRAGLLEEGPFHRGFRFADPEAAAAEAQLAAWFQANVAPRLSELDEARPGDMDALVSLKLAEHSWMREALAQKPAAATNAPGSIS
jgi:radical SAM superfamily enzyme YgiQ (UPF0313 family)